MPADILIVEDEILLLNAYQEFITQQFDAQLRSSQSGKDAVEALQAQLPDIIFLDWWLPLGGGEAVLSYLKEQNLDTPCVIISGVAAQIPDHWTKLPNIRYVLSKPFALTSFITILKDCLPLAHHK